MTVVEHLEEMRKRIIISLSSILAASIISYLATPQILKFISKPVGKLIFISPYEAFLTSIKIAVFCGIFLSSPVVLYQIWRFVSVGLKPVEYRYIMLFLPFSLLLFLGGAAFALFIVVPYGMRFLLSFATESVIPMLSLGRYVSAVGVLMLSFGIAFQLPIVIAFLSKIGLVTYQTLKQNRKYALLLIFVIAAMLTPGPDIFSQVALAIPLLILYEIGICMAGFVKR